MEIKIEISEDELKEAVLNVIAREYYRDYSADRKAVNRVTAECVRQIIYKDKERIIDRIVAQASRECKGKAVKKLVGSLVGEQE